MFHKKTETNKNTLLTLKYELLKEKIQNAR